MARDDGKTVHLLKLCVGAQTTADLAAWQRRPEAQRAPAAGDRRPVHVTRMWPRRSDDLVGRGSLYWVIGGAILARQRVVGLERATGDDGIGRCALILDPHLVRTEPRPRKPFQGWRYLEPADTPPDLDRTAADPDSPSDSRLPPALQEALTELGLLER